MISNTSLINLFRDLKEYGDFYITTRKLNHDVVEHFFSSIKGMTGLANNCMTALVCIILRQFFKLNSIINS